MRYMRKLHPYLDILVSSIGEVFVPQSGARKAHWTFGYKRSDGYRTVQINGKAYKVHRLVVEAFIGPCPEGFECNHKNRDRSDNRLDNLEWITHQDNCHNTTLHDRVTERGGTHSYEDKKKFNRERATHYRAEHPEKIQRWEQARRKTHKRVHFADGSQHWVPLAEADAYLIIPLKERHYAK